ncbi:hypothetical protein MTR67_041295, partial [Solanum verrucosum]
TFLIQTAQLPKGITHSYELGIAQTQRRWKGYSKIFPTISGNKHNFSGLLKLTKKLFSQLLTLS